MSDDVAKFRARLDAMPWFPQPEAGQRNNPLATSIEAFIEGELEKRLAPMVAVRIASERAARVRAEEATAEALAARELAERGAELMRASLMTESAAHARAEGLLEGERTARLAAERALGVEQAARAEMAATLSAQLLKGAEPLTPEGRDINITVKRNKLGRIESLKAHVD